MDAIAGLLDGPRAREAFLLRSSMDPPWSLRIEDEAPLTVVAMVRGDAWVIRDGEEPVPLRRGDVAIIRGPEPYAVADDPATPPQVFIGPGQVCTSPTGEELAERMSLGVRTWGNSADGATVMLTGTYQLSGEVSRRLLRALPPLIVLADEIVKDEPGQEAVLDRLLDLLLIAVLRAWFARPESGGPSWYRAYGDPVDGRRAGARDRDVARGARPALPRARRRAADDVPHRLAHRARGRPAARAGHDDRIGRRAGRLRQPVRAQHGVQARARHQPAAAPPRRPRRVTAVALATAPALWTTLSDIP